MAGTLPIGVARTASGYRTSQWIPDPTRPQGRIATKRWKADATLTEMTQWREAQRVQAREPKPAAEIPPTITGFAADALIYLEAVRAMPTFKDRARDIGEWIAAFADTPRKDITPTMIRTCRDRWLTVGPRRVHEKQKDGTWAWVSKPGPLAASTVNHRLRALENLYTVLDGRHAPNPVREVPEADPPDEAPRALTYDVVRAILAAMPDRAQGQKGVARDTDSKTKARLAVMAYAGLSQGQLMRVKPEDVNVAARTLYLRPRRKGRAGRDGQGVTVPLLPQAVKAFKDFAALACWGKFSASSMRMSFRRACASLHLDPTIRPYDLRHSFGTIAYASTGDLRATGVLLGHRDPRTTMRYTMAAVDPRLQLALKGIRIPKAKPAKAALTAGKVSPTKSSRRVRTRRNGLV